MQPLLNNLIKTNRPMIHRALLVKKQKSVLQNITFIGDHTLSYINLLYRIGCLCYKTLTTKCIEFVLMYHLSIEYLV